MKLWSYEQKDGFYSIRDEQSNERIAFDLSKEQAEEIVRAVNAHDALVKVVSELKDFAEFETNKFSYDGDFAEDHAMLENARAALKLAKGE